MASASLTDLNAVARRLVLELRDGLARLERQQGSAPSAVVREVAARLAELSSVSAQMEATHRAAQLADGGSSKRELWQRKVETVAEELAALRAAHDRVARTATRQADDERSRKELFHRASDGGAAKSASEYDAERNAFDGARRANSALEDMLDHGARVLHAMGGQRERLKGAQRRVLDVLNAAGMSEALLRRADRRQRGDALLVYAGMLLVLLLLGLLLWATKGWRSR